jgi:hypothetical protein
LILPLNPVFPVPRKTCPTMSQVLATGIAAALAAWLALLGWSPRLVVLTSLSVLAGARLIATGQTARLTAALHALSATSPVTPGDPR